MTGSTCLAADAVSVALAASESMSSEAAAFVRDHIEANGVDAEGIELDFSATSWTFIFQDIVKRSTRLDHVAVVSAFTCSRMRPDGFGGMAMLITADAVAGKSTDDILNDLLHEANLDLTATS